jgi:hypothetical protein
MFAWTMEDHKKGLHSDGVTFDFGIRPVTIVRLVYLIWKSSDLGAGRKSIRTWKTCLDIDEYHFLNELFSID